eukprot:CAMPEP_0194168394 /NCGR_PEP_ID=MMETSP0154-20130528/3380_1 /TAXON_ID=1049557 /ORGANISM="Thalassiothrix antarctica, Strain L6-D1" /LENGTH=852 /DNA_ID=CAMNT_0038879525 /DNA_START=49 /DNA_END=2607 /DNA_ORIENTATION=+
MATLLPSLSSDEEGNYQKNVTHLKDESDEEMSSDFQFGGILGEDGVLHWEKSGNGWSYQAALDLLEKNDTNGLSSIVPRIDVTSIISAKRRALKGEKRKERRDEEEASNNSSQSESQQENVGSCGKNLDEINSDINDSDSNESEGNDLYSDESDNTDSDNTDSDNTDSDRDEKKSLEDDKLKLRAGEEEKLIEEDSSDKDEREQVSSYFDNYTNSNEEVEVFAQLTLSRPLLRGVAAMGFTKPTPIQASVIPVALAGRDVCASAQTGSGKTAAFALPILERIYQRSYGGTKGLILTPTRELAAQCLGMITTISQFTKIRLSLIVGGARNINTQAAELRSRPDIIVATPGRLLDHITNSSGVSLDDIEFLVLDECDRLLQLGFQEEVHELVKACPSERQTYLFSATLSTKVEELVKLSLKRPVRIKITGKANSNCAKVEVADRLEQEFVRVRAGNEGINRQGMLLALLTRTFKSRIIVFFDTKKAAHRMMILCGLCGIKCSELHGDLTQVQRLSALEEFRKGNTDVLLATDLAARGLDIDKVKAVINYEMPRQIETYVHRIGRTARRGRAGKSCTLIGETRRHLMKEIIRDAEEKAKQGHEAGRVSGVIRSRTIPPSVIAHFVNKIDNLDKHIEEVIQAEAIAKLDRVVEMEAIKAQNLIKHEDDIKSRPRREWFLSNKQKEITNLASAEKALYIAENVGQGTHRMTRKKRRIREAKDQLLGINEGIEADSNSKMVVTDKIIKKSARIQKRDNLQRETAESNSSIKDDEEKLLEKRKQKENKRKNTFSIDSLGDGSLFDEQKVTFSAKKEEQSELPKSSYNFRGFDPNFVDKKKPKKKAVHSFKSKSKFKRRK